MEVPDTFYSKDEYVETASGNKVSRQTVLCGSQNIVLNGKVIVQSGAIIRGDLANVRTGRYCVISKNAVIRPPYKQFSKGIAFFPMHIGDHVFIGEDAVVSAAVIGSFVYIGKNAVVGRRCVLKDCCIIEDNAILPPETTVASYMRFTAKGTIEGGQGNPNFVPAAMQDQMADAMADRPREVRNPPVRVKVEPSTSTGVTTARKRNGGELTRVLHSPRKRTFVHLNQE